MANCTVLISEMTVLILLNVCDVGQWHGAQTPLLNSCTNVLLHEKKLEEEMFMQQQLTPFVWKSKWCSGRGLVWTNLASRHKDATQATGSVGLGLNTHAW